MVDEFQRIGQSNRRAIERVNTGIHRLYNSCPTGLVLVLTYSFGVPENIKYLVSPDVRTRVNRVFNLPTLTLEEAAGFIIEMIATSSEASRGARTFAPDAITAIVKRLNSDSSQHVTPRKLMQAFSTVLDKVMASESVALPISKAVAEELYEAPVADQLELTGQE